MALTLLQEEIDHVEVEIERWRNGYVTEPRSRRCSANAELVSFALVWDQARHWPVAVEYRDGPSPPNLAEILTQPGFELGDLHRHHD